MSTRFFFGMALAFLLVLAAGVAAIVGVTSATDRVNVVDDSSPIVNTPVPPQPLASLAPPNADLPQPVIAPVAPAVVDGNANVVLDSDLTKLAEAVKLGNTATGDVSKDVWAKEVPVAQRLLKGMCDCDQRNWLKHFVETGQEAVSGSSHYPDSVILLAKLRRGNTVGISASPAR